MKELKYTYLVGIRLASPAPIKLNEAPFLGAITDAIAEYNASCADAPNPKRIEYSEKDFFKDSFIITLRSGKPLSAVGKALRLLSQNMVNSTVLDPYIHHKKVFVTFPVTQAEEGHRIVDPDKIPDTELLKALIDYICNKSDSSSTTYKQKRAAMAQIKQIALESGIYTLGQ